MNKAQLAQTMAMTLNCNTDDTHNLLDIILQQIQAALVEGDKVYLTNFGTFELRYCLAKDLNNCDISDEQPCQPISLGYNKPSFKPSNGLKIALNDG